MDTEIYISYNFHVSGYTILTMIFQPFNFNVKTLLARELCKTGSGQYLVYGLYNLLTPQYNNKIMFSNSILMLIHSIE